MASNDRAPTSDQIRSSIDSGSTGDKVEWPDPAAAPLGADAEAAGAPPGPDARNKEAERVGEVTSYRPVGSGAVIYAVIAVALLAAFAAVVWTAS